MEAKVRDSWRETFWCMWFRQGEKERERLREKEEDRLLYYFVYNYMVYTVV